MLNIDGDTTVRDLLTRHPSAFEVLASHGMCRSCRDSPPPVPLRHFAARHCNGDLDGLVRQIVSVTREGT